MVSAKAQDNFFYLIFAISYFCTDFLPGIAKRTRLGSFSTFSKTYHNPKPLDLAFRRDFSSVLRRIPSREIEKRGIPPEQVYRLPYERMIFSPRFSLFAKSTKRDSRHFVTPNRLGIEYTE